MPEVEVLRSSSVVAVLADLTAAVSVTARGRGIRLTASRQIAPTTARRTLRRVAARRIVHHHPARAHEVACGALDMEVVHDLGPRVRRDAHDGPGARAGSLPVRQRGYCSRSRENSTNQSGTARDGNGIDLMTPPSMFRVAIASVGVAAE